MNLLSSLTLTQVLIMFSISNIISFFFGVIVFKLMGLSLLSFLISALGGAIIGFIGAAFKQGYNEA